MKQQAVPFVMNKSKAAKKVEILCMEERKIINVDQEGNNMKEQIMAVQRMQDYIEEHLEQEITLSELSKASLFSPFGYPKLTKSQTPPPMCRALR
jgi:YesN/AraC family two-component response regulator